MTTRIKTLNANSLEELEVTKLAIGATTRGDVVLVPTKNNSFAICLNTGVTKTFRWGNEPEQHLVTALNSGESIYLKSNFNVYVPKTIELKFDRV